MVSERKIQQSEVSELKNKGTVGAPQLKRRRLLKSTVAIPVIMTLSSGAALARTSNLVGNVSDPASAATMTNAENQTQIVCAIPDPLEDQTGAPPYDLGNSPRALLGPADKDLLQQGAYCESPPQNGIMISVTAFTSLQGKGLQIL